MVKTNVYDAGAHDLVLCNIEKCSSFKHATIPKRVFEALDGPIAASLQLLKQEGTNYYLRYMIRLTASAPPIFVERFFIPLDSLGGDGKIWGIFRPIKRDMECTMCQEKCQAGPVSTCPYATLMHG